jgi:AcrR family transcriptional regulator
MDRRKQRTRRALREALVSLILEKGYDAITVQDITDRADLNRGTLYLHYRDKNDLLMRSSQDIYDELLAEFEPLTKQRVSAMDIPKRNLVIIFSHVAANANFYRVILGENGVPAFRAKLREIIIQVGLKRLVALERLKAATPTMPSDLLIGFAEGAIMGVIEWWLENNLSPPVEVVAQYTLDLVVNAVYPMIGLKIPTTQQDSG